MNPAPGLFALPEQVHSLFFALLPDPRIAQAMVQVRGQLERQLPPEQGSGVPPQRLHLTLHWLGEWPELHEPTAQAALAAADGIRMRAMELVLDRSDCFGHGERVWVLRPSTPPQALLDLHAELAAGLARARLRLPAAPAFAPHVSLRRRARSVLAAGPVPPVHWPVDGLCLVHRLRQAGRTAYRRLGYWPLASR